MPSGRTESGWSAKDFVENFEKGRFAPKHCLDYYTKFKQAFAFVMRGVPYVAIDIDGKNGGLATAQILRLPPTLAETSKGGNGYHLFYEVPGAKWDRRRGYQEMQDHNGIVPGIDVRGTGVVYHHHNQLWNSRPIAMLPKSLYDLLERAQEARQNVRLTKSGTEGLDEDELVLVHDKLRNQLEMPARVGTRNQRLFAIGCQMFASNYPNWDRSIMERGEELGLDVTEVNSIIENIIKYG
jgi:hypothetical protein